MYIRATKTHAKSGEARHSYRLVRSDRIGGKVRQSTLLNLGVHFDTPRDQWGALVLHIENLLQGQPTLVFDPGLQHTAEAIVAQLRARGIGAHAKPEGEPDSVMTVDMDSLEHPEHARSVGAERVCLQALEDLGLKDTLIQAGAKERDARLAVALVVARMLHPSSERATLQWLQSRSTTLDLLYPPPSGHGGFPKWRSRVDIIAFAYYPPLHVTSADDTHVSLKKSEVHQGRPDNRSVHRGSACTGHHRRTAR